MLCGEGSPHKASLAFFTRYQVPLPPPPLCDNQKHLQTLANVSQGPESPQVEPLIQPCQGAGLSVRGPELSCLLPLWSWLFGLCVLACSMHRVRAWDCSSFLWFWRGWHMLHRTAAGIQPLLLPPQCLPEGLLALLPWVA
jgi:hypothetical protein